MLHDTGRLGVPRGTHQVLLCDAHKLPLAVLLVKTLAVGYRGPHILLVKELRVGHNVGHLVEEEVVVPLDLGVPFLIHLLLLEVLGEVHELGRRLVVDGGPHLEQTRGGGAQGHCRRGTGCPWDAELASPHGAALTRGCSPHTAQCWWQGPAWPSGASLHVNAYPGLVAHVRLGDMQRGGKDAETRTQNHISAVRVRRLRVRDTAGYAGGTYGLDKPPFPPGQHRPFPPQNALSSSSPTTMRGAQIPIEAGRRRAQFARDRRGWPLYCP